MSDKRALNILLNTYWGKGGWQHQVPDADDLEYATSKGYMFSPVTLSHDQAVKQAIASRDSLTCQTVADAFVGSLSNRALAQRSAFGSYVCARHLKDHTCLWDDISETGAKWCNYCGVYELASPEPEDLSVLNFERHKWGGVRHYDPTYIWLDLQCFQTMQINLPSAADYAILRNILDIAANQPMKATPNHLAKAIGKTLPSSSNERQMLIGILGFCGVLKPANHDSFFDLFIPADHRPFPGGKNDWSYPVSWWRGADGVNEERAKALFPDL